MSLCVIPARGGSKRIPRKNIKAFHGKPMIAWSIEAAQKSKVFDEIMVSTDDEEISEIARSYGASVPFLRPASLSNDHANTTAVMAHSCEWAIKAGLNCDVVCCLYATSPFVRPDDLVDAHKVMISANWQYVFSASEYSSPIFRSFEQIAEGGVKMFFPEHFETRSQDLPEALFDAGMFYMARPDAWVSNLRVFDSHSYPFRIPGWRVQDIDTPSDWDRAERLFGVSSGESR